MYFYFTFEIIMKFFQDHSLRAYNTFDIDVIARELIVFETEEEIKDFVSNHSLHEENFLVMGEGSNILFSKDFDGKVLRVATQGIQVISEDAEYVVVTSSAGENWDSFVQFCVEKEWGGLENLSLIPGNVGSSPIQNIGAYGAEMSTYFQELEAINIRTGKVDVFSKTDCRFGYRDSLFKKDVKGEYIILNVTFRLEKNHTPDTIYKGIRETLAGSGIHKPGIADVRDAVIAIRKEKLPDPEIFGNAGSFYKNPVIDFDKFKLLKDEFPGIPGFISIEGKVKVPAAWLIDQAGWKGRNVRGAGVHDKQPLVLINLGEAGSKDILELSERIRKSVSDIFNIQLENEVNII